MVVAVVVVEGAVGERSGGRSLEEAAEEKEANVGVRDAAFCFVAPRGGPLLVRMEKETRNRALGICDILMFVCLQM